MGLAVSPAAPPRTPTCCVCSLLLNSATWAEACCRLMEACCVLQQRSRAGKLPPPTGQLSSTCSRESYLSSCSLASATST